jgi:hypothetical protein
MPDVPSNSLIRYLQRPGSAQAVAAAQVQHGLGISQPTLSRLVRSAGDAVVRIGKARTSRYALARTLGRAGSRWPVYRIDANGRPSEIGRLHALARGAWWWQPADPDQNLPLLHGEFADGLFPDWPWFLDDQRPQGFLGRAFARRVGSSLGAPEDLRLWRDEDIALALLQHGHDSPGDLVFGDAALRRALDSSWDTGSQIAEEVREQAYPMRADLALHGDPAGSSAAGEQPKFALTLMLPDGNRRAVIVKFSERLGTPASRRWADLLCCEHIAAEVLSGDVRTASTQLLQADGRVFLESTRFDRTQSGRRGLVSLAALDAAFYGHGARAWHEYAAQLQRDGWLDVDNARQLALTGWFGTLIGNSDMHLGNMSLELRDQRPLPLAPVYDMLPMRWRPAATGEVLTVESAPEWRPPLPLPHEADDWLVAAKLALHFWQEAAATERISEDFRTIARSSESTLETAIQRVVVNFDAGPAP